MEVYIPSAVEVVHICMLATMTIKYLCKKAQTRAFHNEADSDHLNRSNKKYTDFSLKSINTTI